MPLFECTQCHVVDNTAVGNFWWRLHDKKPMLCCECDPDINKWHGHFPRTQYGEYVRKYGAKSVEYPVVTAPDGTEGLPCNISDLLHVLRNPYDHSEEVVREARLRAADIIESIYAEKGPA